MLTTASVVAGYASARTATSTGNTIATEHSHLVMRVLAGGSTSARSKFARECDVACGQYHMLNLMLNYTLKYVTMPAKINQVGTQNLTIFFKFAVSLYSVTPSQ